MGVPDNLPPEAPRLTAADWSLLAWCGGVALLILVAGAFAIATFLKAP